MLVHTESTVKKLRADRNAFFEAKTAEALRQAVEMSRKGTPQSAELSEIVSHLYRLEGRHRLENDALIDAVELANSEQLGWLLTQFRLKKLSTPQQQRLTHILTTRYFEVNPSSRPELLPTLFWLTKGAARDVGFLEISQSLGIPLVPLIVGPFDNDQGKAFDMTYPPERDGVSKKALVGTRSEVYWRPVDVIDEQFNIYLDQTITPSKWQTAYAQSEFDVLEQLEAKLILSTSNPVKVWVNGQLVFQSRTISRLSADNVILPLTFPKGRHRVMVKTLSEGGGWRLRMRLDAEDRHRLRRSVSVFQNPEDFQNPIQPAVIVHESPKIPTTDAYDAYRFGKTLLASGEYKAAVESTQRALSTYPGSVLLRQLLAESLVANGERGQASDLIGRLEKELGSALPGFSIDQAKFWSEQKMRVKARELIKLRLRRHADNWGLTEQLAKLYLREKWFEEANVLIQTLVTNFPQVDQLELLLASSYRKLKQFRRAEAVYRGLVQRRPLDITALRELRWIALGNDRFDEALDWGAKIADHYPYLNRPLWTIAETYRRSDQLVKAEAVLKTLRQKLPNSGRPWRELGRIYLLQNRETDAVEAFRRAQQIDPDDRKAAVRLAWLTPGNDGPWREDIPTDEQIRQAIEQRPKVGVSFPGADTLALIDDEVSWLQSDGSMYNVVTMVMHALNQEGRDELTQMTIRRGGMHQLLNAYAVNASGQRIEASSIRGRTVRYRQLDVGSTVVLQYRIDERPEPYLSGHISRSFWFNSINSATRKGRWVLWTDSDETVHQDLAGNVVFVEAKIDNHRRLEWQGQNVPALFAEPGMPSLSEVAARVTVSTVPSWSVFQEWEKALLVNAFRTSPEVKEIAQKLAGAQLSKSDLVLRIHNYVIEKIRYQQDYEVMIAGVKPHTATQVIARQYGDCKDKAVLFITLAREFGIDVHFASVRTRDRGPLLKKTPAQQFNHAIVYVPKQEGIDQPRFFDPTVDTLDLQVLRSDDQGTIALVYDDLKQRHYWEEIPFQAPEDDKTEHEVTLSLARDGSVNGRFSLKAQGDFGAFLRTQTRNKENFKRRIAQQIVNIVSPGGQVTGVNLRQVNSLAVPAEVSIDFSGKGEVRNEGKKQRWKLPIRQTSRHLLAVQQRHYPFLQGKPRQYSWVVNMKLPTGARLARPPKSVKFEHPCLSYERRYDTSGSAVTVRQLTTSRCERISRKEIGEVQAMVREIVNSEQTELVLTY